ncbi:Phospholipase D [Tolypocladium paradoxum]|uniref:Phospholipase D n=1 Tax=Tolypocladium paradoxum TaxID=94208 RepID=A0A2S4KXQ6_9HYPO|nr:Phospholipase D [Tolypocladium paradoxum]
MAPIRRVFGGILAAAAFLNQLVHVQAQPNAELSTSMDPIVTRDDSQDGSCPRPFYAIAHRCNMDYSIKDAIRNGANAFEIDMTAWSTGWFADHGGTLATKGDDAEKIFRTIADERLAGRNVIFVWLDLKNPDWGDGSNPTTSIEGLRDLARKFLEPIGVRVLYGFYSYQIDRRAYNVISAGLNDNEAINFDGNAEFVQQKFAANGPPVVKQRVMSDGLTWWRGPDHCTADGGICMQLRKGADSKSFNKVFGWTITKDDAAQAIQMMSDSDVDGLIYGFASTSYYDHEDSREALSFITNWLDQNKDKRYLATVNDPPW